MWSMLLRAFYNLTTYQSGRKHLTKKILLIANTATLANYYGALDSVKWTLAQMVYQEQPGVWKLVAEQPRFFLVLGYRLQCMDIFIDAVKHLAGCMAFGYMLWPHVFRPNAPSDLALNGYVPESIITLIDKASKEIEAYYLDTFDRLNDALDPPLSPGSEEGLLQHIACYRIAKFLNGHIIGSLCHPGDFGDEEVHRCLSAGPRMIRLLWHLQAERDLTAIGLALELADAAHVFNQDLTAVCRASLAILETHPVYTLLEEFVNGTKQVSTCRECKASALDPEPVYRSEFQTKQLCPRHGHKAMYHTVDYETTLKTGAVTGEMANHENRDWILAPNELFPDIPSFREMDDHVVARETISNEELRQLSLLDSFTVRTD